LGLAPFAHNEMRYVSHTATAPGPRHRSRRATRPSTKNRITGSSISGRDEADSKCVRRGGDKFFEGEGKWLVELKIWGFKSLIIPIVQRK